MKKFLYVILFVCVLLNISCTRSNQTEERISVLVFITGVIAGSPAYEMMSEGALEFAKLNNNINIKIYEAGMNQATWEQQLAEMVSEGGYDVVIGSNPSLPEMCAKVGLLFPDQKFIIVDADFPGNNQIKTYSYNQYEQSLFLGYLAGLVTTSDLPYANRQKKIGFIAAQEYPLLTNEMIPGFIEGARLADIEIELDTRVIGNWSDAGRAADLTFAMINSDVDVFTAIAGGAAQGLIRTVSERGAYIVWYNTNAYSMAPGFIVGCGIMEQKKLVTEILSDIMENKVQYGVSSKIGVKEGYLGFIFDDSGYKNLPVEIKEKFEIFFYSYF